MKRRIVSAAVLAALAATGLAQAQSSVTMFGTLDVGIAHLTGEGTSRTGLSTGGANISRFGWRGVEDLGGGLAASFWLEAGLNVDDGTTKGAGGALAFNRRSTVSLSSVTFGELRLGRDDSATFLNTLIFDPFLTNGVGGNNAFVMLGAPIQISNAVSYFLPPNLGGFYGQVQHVFGEALQTTGQTDNNPGDYNGIRLGYQNGPLNMAGAYGKLRGATEATNLKIANVGATYDFGVVRPTLLWASEELGTTKITAIEAGLVVPIGAGQLRAQVSRYNTDNGNADWKKYALGYGYNLSRRTQVYGTIAHVSNDTGSQRAIAVQGLLSPGNSLGRGSSGYEVGIRHFF
ncbi:MAG TPA: porin [Reyranella sp.]|nr:porin [Reyranella sp.]